MTQTVTQEVEKRQAGPIALMWSRRPHFRAVLPSSVDVEAFLGTAAAALYASDIPGKTETLMKYAQASPDSLIVALMRCAALGHMPGTDEFYLTPRRVKGKPSVLGIEGYRGAIERMYRSGAVANVIVREVCARDKFRYVEGVDDKPMHSFGGDGTTGADFFGAGGSRDRGEMVGVYAYAVLTTGAVSRVVLLNRDDVHAARAAGGWKADDEYSPWNRLDAGPAHPEFQGRSMWWKTGAKRLEPWVPTSAEYRREQLRASAAAADLSGMRARVPDLPTNGNAHPPEDIQDAEVVEDITTPSAPPAANGHAASQGQPAGKPAVAKLERLLGQLQLGPDEDVRVLMEWQCGGPYSATRSQVTHMTGWLDDHLQAVQGDFEEAKSAVWRQFNAVHTQDAAAEGPQDGGSDD
ncbi:MAG TPA: recombinase RecT [Streptosporangiaceae bacterium]|nr:recombinase RecT [Streptosporangiaceae bacterium]